MIAGSVGGMKITTPMHYYSQWDNALYPGGSCNLTCAAMVLKTLGLKGPAMGHGRLPDNLLAYADKHGIDRHTLEGIDKILETFGARDRSSYTTSPAALKAHLKKGKMAIVHGNFTPSGHIIALHGVDEKAGKYLANDPAGRWNNGYHDYSSGEDVWYDSAWLMRMIAPDGVVWAHLINE